MFTKLSLVRDGRLSGIFRQVRAGSRGLGVNDAVCLNYSSMWVCPVGPRSSSCPPWLSRLHLASFLASSLLPQTQHIAHKTRTPGIFLCSLDALGRTALPRKKLTMRDIHCCIGIFRAWGWVISGREIAIKTLLYSSFRISGALKEMPAKSSMFNIKANFILLCWRIYRGRCHLLQVDHLWNSPRRIIKPCQRRSINMWRNRLKEKYSKRGKMCRTPGKHQKIVQFFFFSQKTDSNVGQVFWLPRVYANPSSECFSRSALSIVIYNRKN